MKSDMSRRYHTRVVTNILYSAVISCLVEIFLVTNVSMIARYMEESGRMNRLLQAVLDYHVAVVLVYVVSGLVLFAVTFMILQEPYIRYISNISDAVQSISEGNLNSMHIRVLAKILQFRLLVVRIHCNIYRTNLRAGI